MTENGLLIVLSGPSGVGKDAVLKRFMPASVNCVRSVSATTRPPRKNEEHGKDYFFVSREEFGLLAERGELLEYALYNGNYYGTPKKAVEERLAEGKNVILKIEVDGASQVRKLRSDAVLVFVAPPSWDALEQRLRDRGTESGKVLEARLATARLELAKASEYDYIIINDYVDSCCERLSAVIAAAGFQAAHMSKYIEEACKNA